MQSTSDYQFITGYNYQHSACLLAFHKLNNKIRNKQAHSRTKHDVTAQYDDDDDDNSVLQHAGIIV